MMRDWGYVSGYEDQLDQRCFSDLIDLSFPKTWGSLYDLCRSSQRERDSYNLMFLFCPIAFAQADSPVVIRTLLAFAFSGAFQEMPAPQHHAFNLADNCPNARLEQALRYCCQHFIQKPSGFTPGCASDIQWKSNRRLAHDREQSSQVTLCQDFLASQWPCPDPSLPSEDSIPLIKRSTALHQCRTLYADWYKNHQFT
jgi:hypothetical protein